MKYLYIWYITTPIVVVSIVPQVVSMITISQFHPFITLIEVSS